MDTELILHIGRRTLEVALLLSAPTLTVTLLVGFVTALLQAVTSIRDMTLGMVIKIAAVGVTLMLSGSWTMEVAKGFTMEIFNHLQAVAQ